MGNTKRSKPKYKVGDIIEEWSYYIYKNNIVAEYIEHYLIVGITRSYIDYNKPRYYYEMKSLKLDNIYPMSTKIIDMRRRAYPNRCTGGYRKLA
jgi:hypothetical protein